MARPAGPRDARAIAQVHVDSWRGGYRGLLADEVLDALSVEERETQWAQRIGADGLRLLVAEHEGRVAGFVAVGLPGYLDIPHDVARVLALYVTPDAWERGLGGALLDAGLRDLPPVREVDLWVVEGNARAIGFYERRGFHADGPAEHDPERGRPEQRMVRPA